MFKNRKFTKLTIFSVQRSSINYMHVIVQQTPIDFFILQNANY